MQKTVNTQHFFDSLFQKDQSKKQELFDKTNFSFNTTLPKKSQINHHNKQNQLKANSTITNNSNKNRNNSVSVKETNKHKDKEKFVFLSIESKVESPQFMIIDERIAYINKKLYDFDGIFTSQSQNKFKNELNKKITQSQFFSQTTNKKCILIDFYCSSDKTHQFVSNFQGYCQSFIEYGKSQWSMIAIHKNKRFDLFSMNSEPTTLWKNCGGPPLTKITVNKQKILLKMLQKVKQKQISISDHQTIIKIEYGNQKIIYLSFKNINNLKNCISNSDLLINQQIFHENITKVYSCSLISAQVKQQGQFNELTNIFQKLQIRKIDRKNLNKKQADKCMQDIIEKLNNELKDRKQELHKVKTRFSQAQEENNDFILPSTRVSIEPEKQYQLNRQIKIEKLTSSQQSNFKKKEQFFKVF